MPQLRCTNCDETSNIQVDDESRMVCGACGTILEENVLVAQVEFQENPAGTSSVVGQFVSNALTRRYGKHAESLTSSSSREAAVAAANRKIESLARQLVRALLPALLATNARAQNIDKPTVLQANQYHRMAQDYGFVRGRRTEYVVAVCLYLACRMREGPYMLIDFSALLGINLFVLGQVYLKFSQRLEMVTIPLIDPALYVRRFASLLEFEDKLESVINTTVRCVRAACPCAGMHASGGG
jgi:transcription factor IIIB subunit 2